MLPPLGAWLGAVVAAKPKSSPSAPSALAVGTEVVAAAAADAEARSDMEADVALACRVVSAALLGAQAAGES